jgi:hypothetical protein
MRGCEVSFALIIIWLMHHQRRRPANWDGRTGFMICIRMQRTCQKIIGGSVSLATSAERGI